MHVVADGLSFWPSAVAEGSWISTSDPKAVRHSIRMTKAEGLVFGPSAIAEKNSLSLLIQSWLPLYCSHHTCRPFVYMGSGCIGLFYRFRLNCRDYSLLLHCRPPELVQTPLSMYLRPGGSCRSRPSSSRHTRRLHFIAR